MRNTRPLTGIHGTPCPYVRTLFNAQCTMNYELCIVHCALNYALCIDLGDDDLEGSVEEGGGHNVDS